MQNVSSERCLKELRRRDFLVVLCFYDFFGDFIWVLVQGRDVWGGEFRSSNQMNGIMNGRSKWHYFSRWQSQAVVFRATIWLPLSDIFILIFGNYIWQLDTSSRSERWRQSPERLENIRSIDNWEVSETCWLLAIFVFLRHCGSSLFSVLSSDKAPTEFRAVASSKNRSGFWDATFCD